MDCSEEIKQQDWKCCDDIEKVSRGISFYLIFKKNNDVLC